MYLVELLRDRRSHWKGKGNKFENTAMRVAVAARPEKKIKTTGSGCWYTAPNDISSLQLSFLPSSAHIA